MTRARAILRRLRADRADAVDVAAHRIADGAPLEVELLGLAADVAQSVLRVAERALQCGYQPGGSIALFLRHAGRHPAFDEPAGPVADAARLAAITARILPHPSD